jgi:hypothetical protein
VFNPSNSTMTVTTARVACQIKRSRAHYGFPVPNKPMDAPKPEDCRQHLLNAVRTIWNRSDENYDVRRSSSW